MKAYRYVTLDPTGNLTCLVLDHAGPEEEPLLTRRLLQECEQVAYLEPPAEPETVAGIRLMGGEFCGNAAMATAVWLVQGQVGPDMEKRLLLRVSGAAEPVLCTARKIRDGYEGTVMMPGVPEIREEALCGRLLTVARMQGIVHVIRENGFTGKNEAEALIREIAEQLPDEAVGLLQWNREAQYMQPLVFVRGSGSLVWERGCGSGSAAVGTLEALRSGQKEKTTDVRQPGGLIRAAARTENGTVTGVSITGQVRTGPEKTVMIR